MVITVCYVVKSASLAVILVWACSRARVYPVSLSAFPMLVYHCEGGAQ